MRNARYDQLANYAYLFVSLLLDTYLFFRCMYLLPLIPE